MLFRSWVKYFLLLYKYNPAFLIDKISVLLFSINKMIFVGDMTALSEGQFKILIVPSHLGDYCYGIVSILNLLHVM